MILRDIGNYLRARGRAGLKDIALHVDAEESAVRGILELWLRKGMVERSLLTPACAAGCGKCNPQEGELYIWRGAVEAQPLPFPRFKKTG
ncbi:MAG: hypothetical protein A2514_04950 [Gammaproteobacteria bacterium RIFOXYD12_FULL_61_37]|nr:MAG: hypothetical protein A2514_04950 [Gammaproteobacteria bacterium RIFOXYD12_FULL_61_37]